MASDLRNRPYSTHGPIHHVTRWQKKAKDEWSHLREGYRSYRSCFQLELDLRKLDVLILERVVHTNA